MIIFEKAKKNSSKLFKSGSYDIRAYVGEPDNFFEGEAVLTPQVMEVIGSLFGLVEFETKQGKILHLEEGDSVVVGYDNGPTSRILAESFSRGLNRSGVNVYNVGLASSGQVYQNQTQLNAAGYCQITRSHVEVTTNGAKFGIGSQGIHTYLLVQMKDFLAKYKERSPKMIGKIIDKSKEAAAAYSEKMKKQYHNYFSSRDNSKIVINVFGGTGIKYIDLFKDILGNNITILGDKLNVNKGNLMADPTRKEMLLHVSDFENNLKLGKRIYSFDLDADRVSITEGSGALLTGNKGHYLGDDLAFIVAEYKLKIMLPILKERLVQLGVKQNNIKEILDIASIVYIDPRYTSVVKTYVENVLHGKTEFHCKGHSLWKETMSNNMLKIAGLAGFRSAEEFVKTIGYRDYQIEASLHLFVTDAVNGVPYDDAVENVFVLEKMTDQLKIDSLERYFGKIPKRYTTKEIRTEACTNESKEMVAEIVINDLKEQFSGKNYSKVVFDGQIRIDWNTGFIMYGVSNTSSKLTYMAEGESIEERNNALSYITALHNYAKKIAGDNTPMNLSENSFFIEDKSYGITAPDSIDFDNDNVKEFVKQHNL